MPAVGVPFRRFDAASSTFVDQTEGDPP